MISVSRTDLYLRRFLLRDNKTFSSGPAYPATDASLAATRRCGTPRKRAASQGDPALPRAELPRG